MKWMVLLHALACLGCFGLLLHAGRPKSEVKAFNYDMATAMAAMLGAISGAIAIFMFTQFPDA